MLDEDAKQEELAARKPGLGEDGVCPPAATPTTPGTMDPAASSPTVNDTVRKLSLAAGANLLHTQLLHHQRAGRIL